MNEEIVKRVLTDDEENSSQSPSITQTTISATVLIGVLAFLMSVPAPVSSSVFVVNISVVIGFFVVGITVVAAWSRMNR